MCMGVAGRVLLLCVCVPMQVTHVCHTCACAQLAVHVAAGVQPCVLMDRQAVCVCARMGRLSVYTYMCSCGYQASLAVPRGLAGPRWGTPAVPPELACAARR